MDTRHSNKPPLYIKRVWYRGDDAVAQGIPIGYDFGGTAIAGIDDMLIVDAPSSTLTNDDFFAGVAADTYPAVVGGQWIDINEPGSVCLVYCGLDCVRGVTMLAWDDGDVFIAGSTYGRGSALAMETDATLTATPAVVLALLLEGSANVVLTA